MALPNPFAWWKLDGNVNDETGTFAPLDITGSATAVTGMIDQCYEFVGDGRFRTLTLLDLDKDNTVSGWISPSINYTTNSGSFGLFGSLIYYGFKNYSLIVDFYGYLCVHYGNGTSRPKITTTVQIQQGEWYHFAVSYTKATKTMRLYVNGALVKTQAVADISFEPYNFTIGRRAYDFSTDPFTGKIDDVRIYDTALSDTDIAELYQWRGVPVPVVVTKEWQFPSNSESWVGTATSPATATWVSANIRARITGRSLGAANNATWDWTGTLSSLGVPAGKRVTALQLSLQYTSVYTTGNSSNFKVELFDGATLLGTLIPTVTINSTNATWTTATGASLPVSLSDSTSITVKITATVRTGNSASAEVTTNWDNISLSMTAEDIPPYNPGVPDYRFRKLMVYYGWPTSINYTYTVAAAADVYKNYDVVVFGNGLQEPTHGDHTNLRNIITQLKTLKPGIEIIGYTHMGQLYDATKLTAAQLKADVDKWAVMGVTGMFLDEFGYDYKVTRELQNDIVNYCHNKGLNVIVNSWLVDYVFTKANLNVAGINANPSNLAPVLTHADYILFESMFYIYNTAQTVSTTARVYEAYHFQYTPQADYGGKSYFQQFGTKSLALDTIANNGTYYSIAYTGAKILNINGYGAANQAYVNHEYVHYPVPPTILDSLGNSQLTVQPYNSVTNARYDRTDSGKTLTLIWQEGVPANSVSSGTRKPLLNGADFIDFIEPTPTQAIVELSSTSATASSAAGATTYKAAGLNVQSASATSASGILTVGATLYTDLSGASNTPTRLFESSLNGMWVHYVPSSYAYMFNCDNDADWSWQPLITGVNVYAPSYKGYLYAIQPYGIAGGNEAAEYSTTFTLGALGILPAWKTTTKLQIRTLYRTDMPNSATICQYYIEIYKNGVYAGRIYESPVNLPKTQTYEPWRDTELTELDIALSATDTIKMRIGFNLQGSMLSGLNIDDIRLYAIAAPVVNQDLNGASNTTTSSKLNIGVTQRVLGASSSSTSAIADIKRYTAIKAEALTNTTSTVKASAILGYNGTSNTSTSAAANIKAYCNIKAASATTTSTIIELSDGFVRLTAASDTLTASNITLSMRVGFNCNAPAVSSSITKLTPFRGLTGISPVSTESNAKIINFKSLLGAIDGITSTEILARVIRNMQLGAGTTTSSLGRIEILIILKGTSSSVTSVFAKLRYQDMLLLARIDIDGNFKLLGELRKGDITRLDQYGNLYLADTVIATGAGKFKMANGTLYVNTFQEKANITFE